MGNGRSAGVGQVNSAHCHISIEAQMNLGFLFLRSQFAIPLKNHPFS